MATTPVIDLGPCLRGEGGALERTARELGAASEGLGFYFIGNHGVAPSLVERMFEQTERFHSLPLERKLAVRMTDKVVGYLPQGGQTQRTSKHGASRHPDTSASYYIRQEFPPDYPRRPWVFEYYAAMERLVRQILRLLHYPPREATLDGQFGIGPHTDYGYLTILAQGRVPGLEILERDRSWIEAPALEGHFLVNNADLASRWTNDRFRSAPHRVINKGSESRYSIPFFTAPRSDVLLECLPTCCGPGNPPKHAPITAGEYFAAINRRNYDPARA